MHDNSLLFIRRICCTRWSAHVSKTPFSPTHKHPQEPYADINYHALLMQLAANPDLRPPLPNGPDWGAEPASTEPASTEPVSTEPAPGWADLMCRCWATDPTARPAFTEVARALKHMASALRRSRHHGAPSEPSLGGDLTGVVA